MNKLINRFKSLSLFFKLTLIILISSIAISAITAFSVMNISRKLFINNFTITNNKILRQIQDSSADLNDKLITVMNTVNNSWAFRKYLTNNSGSTIEQATTIYNMKQHLKPLDAVLDPVNIDFVVLGTNSYTYTRSSALLTSSKEAIRSDSITKYAFEYPDRLLYQYRSSGFTSSTENSNVIIATKVLQDKNTNEQFGILYILINENVFSKFYSNFPTKGNDIFLMSYDGTIVSSNNKGLIGKKDTSLLDAAKKIDNATVKYMNIKSDSRDYTVMSRYMPIYNLYLINRVDTKTALDDMYNVNEIVVICAVIILISVIVLFFITRKTTKPLRILVKQMSKVADGNFNNHINLQGGYEISQLSKSFNIMLDDLNEYVEQLLIAQEKQRQAELAALQMQINPHFIYNTLASIKWLVFRGDTEKASETIDAFISLLQNTVGNTSETITVEQEIENLKNYVFINEMRYGDNIKTTFHVMPQHVHYKLPKLILQPFIENAFFHAFTDEKEGRIHVFISEKNNKLLCEVMDNGTGIDEKQISNLYSSIPLKSKHFTGIGIKNVDDRIKLLYGSEYGVTINSQRGTGTTISVSLPLIEA
ncbi:HAMP domain protein [Clostridiales bacterium oral taxon 876 str. F0540]|nr:HAMP domain protein [Clostridiales bacterium oral taxon 876 str. F0540]